MATDNTISNNPTDKGEPDKYFLHFVKYEQCIYVLGIVGAISQMAAVVVNCAHLATGLKIENPELKEKAIIFSGIGMTLLTGTAFSEILLLRAVNQRILRYIQWWMTSTFMILLFSVLMTVIIGFTLFDNALWITLSFAYILIRMPFQMYFVDGFAHAEIFHKQPHLAGDYKSVLYRRFL